MDAVILGAYGILGSDSRPWHIQGRYGSRTWGGGLELGSLLRPQTSRKVCKELKELSSIAACRTVHVLTPLR